MANLERMVGQILKQFEASGWVETGYGALTLTDPKALRAFAAEGCLPNSAICRDSDATGRWYVSRACIGRQRSGEEFHVRHV